MVPRLTARSPAPVIGEFAAQIMGARRSSKSKDHPALIAEQSKAYPAHSKNRTGQRGGDAKVAAARKERTMILITLEQMDYY
jgi:hypothetical protein